MGTIKVRVPDIEESGILFKDLYIGTVFLYNMVPYMKVSYVCAISLSPSISLITMNLEWRVFPREAELIIAER